MILVLTCSDRFLWLRIWCFLIIITFQIYLLSNHSFLKLFYRIECTGDTQCPNRQVLPDRTDTPINWCCWSFFNWLFFFKFWNNNVLIIDLIYLYIFIITLVLCKSYIFLLANLILINIWWLIFLIIRVLFINKIIFLITGLLRICIVIVDIQILFLFISLFFYSQRLCIFINLIWSWLFLNWFTRSLSSLSSFDLMILFSSFWIFKWWRLDKSSSSLISLILLIAIWTELIKKC